MPADFGGAPSNPNGASSIKFQKTLNIFLKALKLLSLFSVRLPIFNYNTSVIIYITYYLKTQKLRFTLFKMIHKNLIQQTTFCRQAHKASFYMDRITPTSWAR